jgi:hypothetical protein
MSALIEQLHIVSPVARTMFALLPHLSPPVVLAAGPHAIQPEGCLHLPTMNLILAGAGGPLDPALVSADAVARSTKADVLLVSIRPNQASNAIRFDALFVEGERTELFTDLLFWTLPDCMPAFVPRVKGAPAVIVGKTTLIPSYAMPYANSAERMAGIARAADELRLALWGEE